MRRGEKSTSNINAINSSLAGDQNWSELFYSDFIDGYAIVLSTPVYRGGDGGQVIGAVNILVDQSVMDRIVHSGADRLGNSEDSYIVDANEEKISRFNGKVI